MTEKINNTPDPEENQEQEPKSSQPPEIVPFSGDQYQDLKKDIQYRLELEDKRNRAKRRERMDVHRLLLLQSTIVLPMGFIFSLIAFNFFPAEKSEAIVGLFKCFGIALVGLAITAAISYEGIPAIEQILKLWNKWPNDKN